VLCIFVISSHKKRQPKLEIEKEKEPATSRHRHGGRNAIYSAKIQEPFTHTSLCAGLIVRHPNEAFHIALFANVSDEIDD
jgi:hypothetical protein